MKTNEIYQNIPYDDLLVFALYSLIQKNKQRNLENLVIECFLLFPQRFGLPGYLDKYPDSAQVEKSWLRCRTDKGWITGDKAHGFEITARGLEVAHKTQKKLGSTDIEVKQLIALKGDRRTKMGRFVKQIEKNRYFKEFLGKKEITGMSDYDFCDLIYSTLDTLPENRRKNLQQLSEAVHDYNRKDMEEFLKMCESKFTYLLFAEDELKKQFVGGMNKRKIK